MTSAFRHWGINCLLPRHFHFVARLRDIPTATVQNWSGVIKTKSWVWPDSYKLRTVQEMQSLLNTIVPQSKSNEKSLHDCHFAFNTQSNKSLGSDGYDNYQAPLGPHGEELFSRRMWVNGSIEYSNGSPLLNQNLDCVETISSVKHLSANVFVKISRVFMDSVTHSQVMKETRTIMYTNTPYRSENISKNTSLNAGSKSCVASVSLDQQMRFNSLTSNMHKIHYSMEHCRKENLRQVVVSGPLLVSIMMHYFSHCHPNAVIKKLTYRNSEPCFVEDVFEIALSEIAEGFKMTILRQNHILCEGTFTVQ